MANEWYPLFYIIAASPLSISHNSLKSLLEHWTEWESDLDSMGPQANPFLGLGFFSQKYGYVAGIGRVHHVQIKLVKL